MRFGLWGGGLAAVAVTGLIWAATPPRESAASVPPVGVPRAGQATTPPPPVETAEPAFAGPAFGPGVLIPATFLLPAEQVEVAPLPRVVN
jgi:hypothetical protein